MNYESTSQAQMIIRHLEGDVSYTNKDIPINNPEAPFPAITICPTFPHAYNASKLKVSYHQ